MKYLLIGILTLLVFSSVLLGAQKNTKALAPEFISFLAKFKAAVAKDDREAVVSMTNMPFLFDSKEQKRDGFLKIYDKLFTARVKRCFAAAKPLKDGDVYEIFCSKTIFLFGMDGGSYKFTEIGVND